MDNVSLRKNNYLTVCTSDYLAILPIITRCPLVAYMFYLITNDECLARLVLQRAGVEQRVKRNIAELTLDILNRNQIAQRMTLFAVARAAMAASRPQAEPSPSHNIQYKIHKHIDIYVYVAAHQTSAHPALAHASYRYASASHVGVRSHPQFPRVLCSDAQISSTGKRARKFLRKLSSTDCSV